MAADETRPATPRPARPCPVCGRVPEPRFRPFCSARCRQVDLGRWLSGDYAIPSRPEDEEDSTER